MIEDIKKILTLMREAGHDVALPEDVDSWTQEEVEYIHSNYAPHYL